VIAQSRSAPHFQPLRDRMLVLVHIVTSFWAYSVHLAVRVVGCRIPQSRSGSTPKGVLPLLRDLLRASRWIAEKFESRRWPADRP
jgi:hypothetical protein